MLIYLSDANLDYKIITCNLKARYINSITKYHSNSSHLSTYEVGLGYRANHI